MSAAATPPTITLARPREPVLESHPLGGISLAACCVSPTGLSPGVIVRADAHMTAVGRCQRPWSARSHRPGSMNRKSLPSQMASSTALSKPSGRLPAALVGVQVGTSWGLGAAGLAAVLYGAGLKDIGCGAVLALFCTGQPGFTLIITPTPARRRGCELLGISHHLGYAQSEASDHRPLPQAAASPRPARRELRVNGLTGSPGEKYCTPIDLVDNFLGPPLGWLGLFSLESYLPCRPPTSPSRPTCHRQDLAVANGL
jgi:hypothetical protein